MTLALDFGSASIKAILIGGPQKESFFCSFSLGFKSPVLNRSSLLSAVKTVELISGERLMDGDRILPSVYACVGLPVFEVAEALSGPVVLTGQAISALDLNILDVGSQFTHFRDRVSVAPVSTDEVAKWLPFKAEVSDISNYIENKRIYSSILPASPRDLFFEQAIARVRVADLFRSQRMNTDFGEVYLSGAVFSGVPYLEQAVLMALDSLQPSDFLKIWLDRNQILPVAGLLKYHSIQEFSHLGDELTPLFLGTVLSQTSSCEVEIDLGFGEGQKISLKKGDLYVFPLRLGEQAVVKITTVKKNCRTYEVTGGAVGLIFDLRGRPLEVPESSRQRSEVLRLWASQIGASGQVQKI